MPLHIDRVETEVDLTRSTPPGAAGKSRAPGGSDEELREWLRPLVLEILEEELERLRRELG